MSRVDLHIHTTASDGRFTPAEIVSKAANIGMAFIAICDHDTVNGLAAALEAAKSFPQLKVIPGIEISSDVPRGEVHVLGLFIDFTDAVLLDKLVWMHRSRERRAMGMVNKLKTLGINITWERVQEIAAGAVIGRPHIAQAMLEKGYISAPREAFIRYIGREGPAYVEREKLTPLDSVKLILQAHGLPVLAHPFTAPEPELMIIDLKSAGLVGIEAYYGGYNEHEVKTLVDMADRYDLIPTGGSDYHGIDESNETRIGGTDVPLESAERLISVARSRGLKNAV